MSQLLSIFVVKEIMQNLQFFSLWTPFINCYIGVKMCHQYWSTAQKTGSVKYSKFYRIFFVLVSKMKGSIAFGASNCFGLRPTSGEVWVPYGSLWSPMVLYGPLWSLMTPYSPVWHFKVPYRPSWPYKSLYGPIWPYVSPY